MTTINKYLDSGFDKLMTMAQEVITLQNMTKTLNAYGDLSVAVDTSTSTYAIFQELDEVERNELAGLQVIASSRAFVDPDEAISEEDRIVRGSDTYEIIKIEEASVTGTNVYKSLLLKKL